MITSLKKVWARVPIKFVELFHQLEDLMTPLGNFKYYRQLLAESRDKKPIIPYLVVFLRYLRSPNVDQRGNVHLTATCYVVI